MLKETMKKMSDAELRKTKSSLSWALVSGETKNETATTNAIKRINRELASRAARAEHIRQVSSMCISYERVTV